MKRLLLIPILLVGFLVKAHSPTEIGFKILEEDSKTYLEIHLTTHTLFDLLYAQNPELKTRESLNLSHYIATYESYFNATLDLNLNGLDQELVYESSNLIIHDAKIKFLVNDFKSDIASYELAINGFEFYQQPSFTVLFRTQSVDETFFLDKEDNTCSGFTKDQAQVIARNSYLIAGLVSLVFIIVGLIFLARLRILPVNR